MQTRTGNGDGAHLGAGWLNKAQQEQRDALDDEPEIGALALLDARLISAADLARVMDNPCRRCQRAQRDGKPRKDCRALGCDRWSPRRARRWLRRSQCLQQPGDPRCPARDGGRCHCQLGMQLWPGGPWRTTLATLRDRLPGVADAMLLGRADDDEDG